MSMKHMGFIRQVADFDVSVLTKKEATYGGSWKKRGGVGAFMMMARKWDRIENMLRPSDSAPYRAAGLSVGAYDIFSAIEYDMSGDDSTILAEVRDLRQYLTLIEAEILARHQPVSPVTVTEKLREALSQEESRSGTPEDGGHHEQVYGPTTLSPPDWVRMNKRLIAHGSMRGEKWGDLYSYTEDGVYKMDDKFTTEYLV